MKNDQQVDKVSLQARTPRKQQLLEGAEVLQRLHLGVLSTPEPKGEVQRKACQAKRREALSVCWHHHHKGEAGKKLMAQERINKIKKSDVSKISYMSNSFFTPQVLPHFLGRSEATVWSLQT